MRKYHRIRMGLKFMHYYIHGNYFICTLINNASKEYVFSWHYNLGVHEFGLFSSWIYLYGKPNPLRVITMIYIILFVIITYRIKKISKTSSSLRLYIAVLFNIQSFKDIMGKTCYELFTHYLSYFYSAEKDKRSIEKAKVLFSKQEIVDVGIRILSGLGWTFGLGLLYILKSVFLILLDFEVVFKFIEYIYIWLKSEGVKWFSPSYLVWLEYLVAEKLDTTWCVTIDALKAILPSLKLSLFVNAVYVLSIRLSKYLNYSHIYFNSIIFKTIEIHWKHLFKITLNNKNFRYWSDIFYITIVCIILFFYTNYNLYWLYIRFDLVSDFSIYGVVTIVLVNTIIFIIICVFIINSKNTK